MSSIGHFKTLEKRLFFRFVCPHCLTAEENVEASSVQQQIAALTKTVNHLVKEIKDMKQARPTPNEVQPQEEPSAAAKPTADPSAAKPSAAIPPKPKPWEDTNRMKKVKEGVTVCIKNGDGQEVDMVKVKNIVTSNGIQVSKASVSKKNGNVYIDLPSQESRDKLLPLLKVDIQEDRIVHVKQKCPTISIRNVVGYVDEKDFIDKVKAQNEKIKEKIENGSEFSVVFARQNKDRAQNEEEKEMGHLIVVRVGEEIRDILKEGGDRIFLGFSSHRIMDRVYIKSCAKCHQFGHYHAECKNVECCGYCMSKEHKSEQCPIRDQKDSKQFKCVNCKEAGKNHEGHSSHYNKCPTYLEAQKKTMNNIPYYAKKQVKKPQSVECNMMVWNVWSIANEEKLINLLQIIEDRNISIACITETWFDRKNGKFSKTIKDAGYKDESFIQRQ